MGEQLKILRTNTGYQLGKLHASGLSPRESQALLLRASGLSVADCAAAMNCCKANVQDRISNMFFKLEASSTPKLITKAFENGYLKFFMLLAAIHLAAALPDNQSINRIRHTRTHVVRVHTRHHQREFV